MRELKMIMGSNDQGVGPLGHFDCAHKIQLRVTKGSDPLIIQSKYI
jgi:hypothetical protein